jgi:hypothetical protein
VPPSVKGGGTTILVRCGSALVLFAPVYSSA